MPKSKISPGANKGKVAKAARHYAPTASDHLPSLADLEQAGGPAAVLASASTSFSDMASNYRERVHTALARVYAVAAYFDDHQDAWQDFCRHPSWNNFKGKKPTVLDTPDKLQPSIRLALGFDDASASKAASKYYAALVYAYQAKLPPNRILAYLEEGGGIEQLASQAAQLRRAGVLGAEGNPMLNILAPLDPSSREIGGLQVGETVKCRITITKSDGIGQIQATIHNVAPAKTKKAG